MKADDDWSTYSDNGWAFSYRHIAKNFIYMTAQKSAPGNNQAITDSLVAAGLPFTVLFNQNIACSMEVAGTPVGYGRARIATNNGMYLCSTAYGSDVTYMVYGVIAIV